MHNSASKKEATLQNLFVQHKTLGTLLFMPYEYMVKQVYSRLQQMGYPDVRPAHSAVLRHILPGGSRLVDLADQAGLAKQSMAYLVQSLHRSDYLLIETDESDHRAKRLRLSAKGQRLQAAAMKISQSLESGLAERLGKTSMRDLRKLLTQLSAVLTEEANNGRRAPTDRSRTSLRLRRDVSRKRN